MKTTDLFPALSQELKEDEDVTIERAWFSNSYPQHTHSVSDLLNVLKYSAIVMIIYEVMTSVVIATKAFQFISIQSSLNTDVVQLGTLIHLFASAMRIAAGFALHNYSSHITERTPKNTLQLSSFLKLVSVISFTFGAVTLYVLHNHGVTKMPAFIQLAVTAILHGIFKILKQKEQQIPKVIDLHAHSS